MNHFENKLDDINKGGSITSKKKYGLLVVDDSLFALKQIDQILESSDFVIIDNAVDGDEAVIKYKENSKIIDIITMDITMPGKNGIEALKEILEYNEDAIVIMISSLGKQEIVKESLMLGAKGFILKPLTKKQVIEQLSLVVKKFFT